MDSACHIQDLALCTALRKFKGPPRQIPRDLPPGVPPNADIEEVYEPAYAAAEIDELIEEGQNIAEGQRIRRGLPPGGGGGPPAPPALPANVPLPPLDAAGAGQTWRVANGARKGEAVVLKANSIGSGRCAVQQEDVGGGLIFAELVDDVNLDAWKAAGMPTDSDARFVDVHVDEPGRRTRRHWRAAALASITTGFVDWDIPGPRTMKWALDWLVEHEIDPELHHLEVLKQIGARKTDPAVQVHGVCCRILKKALTFDGADPPNLAHLEIVARDIQTAEYHCKKLKEAEVAASSSPSPVLPEEADILAGKNTEAGAWCVSPTLRGYLGEEMLKVYQQNKGDEKLRAAAALRVERAKKKWHEGLFSCTFVERPGWHKP